LRHPGLDGDTATQRRAGHRRPGGELAQGCAASRPRRARGERHSG
jgi:hypothetical protein